MSGRIVINPATVLERMSAAEQMFVGGREFLSSAEHLRSSNELLDLASALEHAEPDLASVLSSRGESHFTHGLAAASEGGRAVSAAAKQQIVGPFARLGNDGEHVVTGVQALVEESVRARGPVRVDEGLLERIDNLGARAVALGTEPGDARLMERPMVIQMDGPVWVEHYNMYDPSVPKTAGWGRYVPND